MINLFSWNKRHDNSFVIFKNGTKKKGFIVAAGQFLGHETATLLMIGKVI
jgi:hypothetical protein